MGGSKKPSIGWGVIFKCNGYVLIVSGVDYFDKGIHYEAKDGFVKGKISIYGSIVKMVREKIGLVIDEDLLKFLCTSNSYDIYTYDLSYKLKPNINRMFLTHYDWVNEWRLMSNQMATKARFNKISYDALRTLWPKYFMW